MPDQRVLVKVRQLLERSSGDGRSPGPSDYSDRHGQEVYRLYRLYAALVRELNEAAQRPEMRVAVEPYEQGLMLTIADPKVNYRRQSIIPATLEPYFSGLIASLGLAAAAPPA